MTDSLKLYKPGPPSKRWRKYAYVYGLRHQRVVEALAKHKDGLTINEVSSIANMSRASIRRRFQELRVIGMIDSQSARRERHGANSSVYTLTESGWDKARELGVA